MGYYYTIDFNRAFTKEEADYLNELSNQGFEEGDDYLYDAKWYDHEEHMIKLSKRFPNKVFAMTVIGEDNEDYYVHAFKNGKHCYKQAIFPTMEEVIENLK